MISLGRSLIASMNGRTYPVKRSLGGSYVNGLWVDALPLNQSLIQWNATEAQIQDALRRNPLMTGVVVDGDLSSGFQLTFPEVGFQPVLAAQQNTLVADETPVSLLVSVIQVGDEDEAEVLEIASSEPPTAGSVIISFGDAPLVTCFASQQPLSGSDIVRIPEGDRDRERLKLYSADRLQISSELTLQAADIVTVNGTDYQVESVALWTDYWKCIIVEIEPSET